MDAHLLASAAIVARKHQWKSIAPQVSNHLGNSYTEKDMQAGNKFSLLLAHGGPHGSAAEPLRQMSDTVAGIGMLWACTRYAGHARLLC